MPPIDWDLITLPTVSNEHALKNRLNAEQIAVVLPIIVEQYPFYAPMIFALYTLGLRYCHVAARRWEKLTSDGVIAIEETYDVSANVFSPVDQRKKAPPVIALEPRTLELVRRHRRYLTQRSHPGLKTGLVFPSEAGTRPVGNLIGGHGATHARLDLPRPTSPGCAQTLICLVLHHRAPDPVAESHTLCRKSAESKTALGCHGSFRYILYIGALAALSVGGGSACPSTQDAIGHDGRSGSGDLHEDCRVLCITTYRGEVWMIFTSLIKAVASLVAVVSASAALAACTSDVVPGSGSRVEVSSASAALTAPPTIGLYSPNNPERWKDTLQFGNNNDAYWTLGDNAWGAGTLTQGTAPDQYEQYLGVSPTAGPNGEVALRIKWRWPDVSDLVKAFPAVLSGMKPGLYSSDSWIVGHPVVLLDGTFSQTAPTGSTPGTFMPQQLPISALTARFARSDVAPPTGLGQLTFDIWLQSQPGQDFGFLNSSITHEIMIPLGNWGNYGAYPNNRPLQWYDHDAVINGKLYHVYCTKDGNGVLAYNFGSLNGHYGRTGWKMIAFVPDVTPVPPGEIDLAAFINYLKTRTDSAGTPWAQGNEYLASVELGVEPVTGTGDLVIYDYKVSPTSPTAPTRIQAENGALSGSGVSVRTDYPGYEGSGFVGSFADAGDRATLSFTNVAAGTYDLRIRYHAGNVQMNNVVINGTTWSKIFPATGTDWGITTISGMALAAGTNTLSIIKDWGFFEVDYAEIAPSNVSSSTARKIQAEAGSLTGLIVETYYSGYEGSGAVGPFANAGDHVTVSFVNVAAGTYDVRIRYHSDVLQLNDVVIDGTTWSKTFPGTGTDWGVTTISRVALAAGTNTVAIIKEWGWIDVDYIEIAPSSSSSGGTSTPTKIQAEDGSLAGTIIETYYSGYEGNGAVGPFANAGDHAMVTFTNVAGGAYDVRIRYHAGALSVNNVVIHGTTWGETFASTGTDWGIATISGVTLAAGANTVSIIKDWGWIDIDYIEIVPSSSGSTATKIQAESGSLAGVIVDTYYVPGYEGSGAVAPFANAGDRATVSFTNVAAGSYDIHLRYHAGASEFNDVAINGISRSVAFPATGDGWAIKTLSGVGMTAGTNTVAVTKDWGWISLDYIEIVPHR